MNFLNSSSFHKLNADKPLSSKEQKWWFTLNHINNNCFPNVIDKKLEIKTFQCSISENDWSHLLPKSSPSRLFSDLFYLKLPWQSIQQELGEIHIFDIGCGKGGYSAKLQDFSSDRITTYTGIDIQPREEWQTLIKDNVQFISAENTQEVINHIPNQVNLIISQSVLEHVENDLCLFRGIRDFIRERKRKTIQIHLVPSEACLDLYRYHGVRQYSPRTLSIIAKLFTPFSFAYLFKLGGQEGYRLHLDYITLPLQKNGIDLRDVETENYHQRLKLAIFEDMKKQDTKPIFYALVIHSYFEKHMW